MLCHISHKLRADDANILINSQSLLESCLLPYLLGFKMSPFPILDSNMRQVRVGGYCGSGSSSGPNPFFPCQLCPYLCLSLCHLCFPAPSAPLPPLSPCPENYRKLYLKIILINGGVVLNSG